MGKKLAGQWPHANPPNPRAYAEAIVDVLEQYPLGVVQECCNPKIGLARSREFPPTVAVIVEWCDKRVTYHRGVVKWGERVKPEPVFSDEHRKSMLERLKGLMHSLFDKQAEAAR